MAEPPGLFQCNNSWVRGVLAWRVGNYVAPEAGKPVGDRKEGYEKISDLDTSIFSKSLIKLISKLAISIYLDLS